MSNSNQAASLDAPTEISGKKTFYAVLASTIGWALDLFDLFILLYVAPIVGKLFFPADSPTLSLAAVYASFAVSLVVRPLGSAIFGAYADRHGRKRAFMVSMVGVGLATTSFGLLPTIAQVGLIAPIAFLALRVVQGLFVGGIVASTHTIGTESISPKYRGLMSGAAGGAGAGLGALFASLVYFGLSQIFPGDEFEGWGWRCMFFFGLISTVFGIVMYKNMDETPYWKKLHRDREQNAHTSNAQATHVSAPLRELFGPRYRKVVAINLLLTIGGGAIYYLTCGYLPTLLRLVTNTSHLDSSKFLMSSALATIVAALFFGWLSDVIGRKKTFIVLGLVSLVAAPLLFLAMQPGESLRNIAWYTIGLGAVGGAAVAPLMIFLNERFATEIRASGTGLSWNIGFALGGMMPTFVSLASSTPADIPKVLAIFSIGLAVLYLIGSAIVPETRGNL